LNISFIKKRANTETASEIYRILKEEKIIFPEFKIKKLFLFITITVFTMICLGNRKFDSVLGFEMCSSGYF